MRVASIDRFATAAHFEAARIDATWQPHVSFVSSPIPRFKMPVMAIARRVMEEFYPHITMGHILGPHRSAALAKARWHIWATVHEERPDLSMSTLGRLFKKDRTTLIHGIERYRSEKG